MIKASIDIGSNSTLLLIAQFGPSFKVLESESRITGLGRKLDQTKNFITESMDDTFNALSEYVKICDKYGVRPEDIIATATEASRVAENSQEFFDRVKTETKIDVKTITSKAEAYYSAKGILFNSSFPESEVVIMDIGGASTELIKVNAITSEVIDSISMPFGAVRVTGWLEESSLDKNLKTVLFNFEKDLAKFQTSKIYCVAGTMTSVGNMHLENKSFNESEVHGVEMNVSDVRDIFENNKDKTTDEMLNIFPFLGKRSKTIHAGLIVALSVFDWINASDIQISTYGLRYGTLVEGSLKSEDMYGN